MTTDTIAHKKKSAWGKGVFLLYGGFVLFILGIVFFSSMQRFDLVESNYYDKELKYQQQIDKMERTNALTDKPVWAYIPSARQFSIKFPIDSTGAGLQGTIHMYRPSNSSYDIHLPLELDDSGMQLFSMADKPKGMWRIKIDWMHGGREYYITDMVVIE